MLNSSRKMSRSATVRGKQFPVGYLDWDFVSVFGISLLCERIALPSAPFLNGGLGGLIGL